MKVKVTYGLELLSVPVLVEDMLSEAIVSLEKQLSSLRGLSYVVNNDSLQAVLPDEIDSVRKELSAVDLSLTDAESIMRGYVDVMKAQSAIPTLEPESPQPDEFVTPNGQTVFSKREGYSTAPTEDESE